MPGNVPSRSNRSCPQPMSIPRPTKTRSNNGSLERWRLAFRVSSDTATCKYAEDERQRHPPNHLCYAAACSRLRNEESHWLLFGSQSLRTRSAISQSHSVKEQSERMPHKPCSTRSTVRFLCGIAADLPLLTVEAPKLVILSRTP